VDGIRLAAVLGLTVFLAPAAWAAEQSAQIDGTYCGSVYAGEQLVDAVTKFETTADGKIRGTYKFMEKGLPISGGLIAITLGEDRTADFRWIDKYGIGRLVVTFAEDLGSFTGLWGTGEGEPQYQWFGRRCSDTAAPGQVT
jgi:hypothetical protein